MRDSPIKIWICLLILLAGCGAEKANVSSESVTEKANVSSESVAHRADHPNASGINADDKEINAAMQKARNTLDQFLGLLDNAQEGDGAIVKAGFPTADGTPEYLWVYYVDFDNGKFSGKLQEDAFDIPNLKRDTKVTFTPEQVGDWLFVHKGKNVGGFTIDILNRRNGEKPLAR